MLAYILAIAVGLGSLAIYIAAFFFPEIYRKSDLLWSGVGLFYALILWTCAGRITGAVLLGQAASVSLLGWFGWQTFSLRRQVTPVAEQTKIPSKESAGKSVKFPEVGGTAKIETSTEVSEIVAATESEETAPELTSVTPPEAIEEISGEIEVPTVAETPSPNELETTETLKNLTQPTETETETKPELETPAVGETTSQEGEVKSEAQQDKAKDSSQKKAGGISILTAPINGLLGNLKNVFGKKDKGKTKVETASKSASEEVGSTVETSETISEFETETPAVVETEVKVTEEEGSAEVEIRQIEEKLVTDGEEEKVTVVEKEAIARVELNDSETSEVTVIEEKVTVTTGEVAAEETVSEIENQEDESKTELISLEKKEEVESPDKSPKVSPKDSDSEIES